MKFIHLDLNNTSLVAPTRGAMAHSPMIWTYMNPYNDAII